MRWFGGKDARNSEPGGERITRVSSGWAHLLKQLKESEGQRILDIGPTSSTDINLLTGLGHSVYMADLVADANDAKWTKREPDEPFPTAEFLEENLNFSGRKFDTVLFWDSADYLPAELLTAVVARLHDEMVPGGQLLGFFHIKPEGDFSRYHLREDGQVDVQTASSRPVKAVLNNRQIEQLFAAYTSYKFFLAKDNLREVVVSR